MKKTLIALLALGGIAVAEPITLTNPAASDFSWVPGRNGDVIIGEQNTLITHNLGAGNVAGIINAVPEEMDLIGWFGGTGQTHSKEERGSEINITGTGSFTFLSRPAFEGEYVMMGITLAEKASSITLSFNADKYLGYALFSYDGQSVTEIMPKAVTSSENKTSGAYISVTKEIEVAPSTLFVVWSSEPNNSTGIGGGQMITVSDISVAYNKAVPEPATATLSLLALAGLAARRRRH